MQERVAQNLHQIGPSAGLKLEIERRGDGPPLLLLPGEEFLEHEAPFLNELAKTHEVIIPSPPGFGLSTRPDWITHPDDIAYMQVEFSGFTYEERFLILSTKYDFAPFGYALTNYIADPDEWCALFKVSGDDGHGLWRVLFPTRVEESDEQALDECAVQGRLQRFFPKRGPYPVVHRSLYNVHQRVAASFGRSRVFLAGDCAHVNNPLGGLGLNFGIHGHSQGPRCRGALPAQVH